MLLEVFVRRLCFGSKVRTGQGRCPPAAATGTRARNRSGRDRRGIEERRRRWPVSRVLCRPCGRWQPFLSAPPRDGAPATYPGTGRASPMPPYLALLRVGFAVPCGVGPAGGGLLPHRFTLTTHPLGPFGGLFSVALSVGSRRPGVTWHPALWSPDFPRRDRSRRGCLATSVETAVYAPRAERGRPISRRRHRRAPFAVPR